MDFSVTLYFTAVIFHDFLQVGHQVPHQRWSLLFKLQTKTDFTYKYIICPRLTNISITDNIKWKVNAKNASMIAIYHVFQLNNDGNYVLNHVLFQNLKG